MMIVQVDPAPPITFYTRSLLYLSDISPIYAFKIVKTVGHRAQTLCFFDVRQGPRGLIPESS